MGFLKGINLIGAVLGFVVGVCGYIILRYWIRPVSAYHRLKERTGPAVDAHMALLKNEARDPNWKSAFKESQQKLRRLASDLTEAAGHDLPQWYRIRLRARQEDPGAAAADLMKLSGTRDEASAGRRAEGVRNLLRLPSR